MDLDIMALEVTLERLLKDSKLPPGVKRLVLIEYAGKMAEESNIAIQKQSQEVKKNAESV